MADFDFIDYIVVYGRKYNTGHTFIKDAFKTDFEQFVPIVYESDHNVCVGGAKLEHRDGGVVAKCKFGKDSLGELAAKLVDDGECGLSFLAIPVKREGGIIKSGTIRAVLLVDKHNMPCIVEE